METYKQMRERHQAELTEAWGSECFFAFSKKQFDEGIEKARAAGIEGEFKRGPLGAFLTDAAWERWKALADRQRKDEAGLMQDHEFAVDAFYTEMCDHEYVCNPDGTEDVLSVFGYELGEEKYDNQTGEYKRQITHVLTGEVFPAHLAGAFNDALSKYKKACNENGWW